ncbi:MAG: metallophosphoesterase, partial [Gemmatimonas sp.]
MARQFDRPVAGGFLKGAAWRTSGAIGFLAAISAGAGVMGAQAGRPAAPAGAASLDLIVAATTDTHGRLRGWDYYANKADPARGLARVGTIMDSLRAANPSRVVLVDAGDLLQGNALTDAYQRSKSSRANPVVATMNALQYDAAAIGNHEFNYGVPFLDAAVKQARFPFLAANVRDANGKLKYAATTVFERGGVRVGIVGATTPGSMVWDRDHLREAKLTVGDIVPAVKAGVADVRARGADVVIVVLHSGFGGPSSYDAAAAGLPEENVAGRIPAEVSGIDLVVFGHSHQEMIDSTVNGTLVIQPRQWATSVGVATISLKKSGAKWTVAAKRAVSVPAAGHAESAKSLVASQFAHEAA